MTPLRQWVSVKRISVAPAAFLWVPVPSDTQCVIGEVTAIGAGRLMKGKWIRPMPVAPGQRVLYSSRVDQYHVGDDKVDVIEDESIIGIMNDDRH